MSNLSEIMNQRVCQPSSLPDDWQWNKLIDVCKPKQWKTISSSEMTTSGYPVFGANGFVGFYSEFNHELETVAITCRGNTCGTINRVPAKTYITGNSMALNDVVNHTVTQDFLFYALNYRSVSDAISGSAQPQITRDSLNLISFPTPPLSEQQKIAAILSSVDDVIEKIQAQIKKLKDLKIGMMQELLSPREPKTGNQTGAQASKTNGLHHTQFKDSPLGRIPVGWEVTSLSTLVKKIHSGWSPVCEPKPRSGSEWGILKTTAVVWDGYAPQKNKVLSNDHSPVKSAVVQSGDILITRKGPRERAGVCVYVKNTPENLMVPDTVFRVILKDDECIDKEYVSLALSSDKNQSEWDRKKVGLAEAQVNINHQVLNSTRIALPPIQVQHKICNTLASIQKNISYKENKFMALKNTKKALMQDLLTGKVRVKVDAA